MKLFVLAAALALSGCAAALPLINTAVSVATPAAPVGDKVVLEGTRALVIAHNAYQGVAGAAKAAIESDTLNPAQVEKISDLSDKALALLNGAEAGLNEAERAAKVMNLVSDLSLALGDYPARAATHSH